MEESQQSRKFIPRLVGIIVVIIIIAGAYFAYSFYFGNPDPKNEIRLALSKLTTVQSFSFTGGTSGEVKTTNVVNGTLIPTDTTTFISQMNGGVDVHAPQDPLMQVNFSGTLHSDDQNTKIDASLIGEGRIVNRTAYMMMSSSSLSYTQAKKDSTSAFFEPIKSMLATLYGTWIQITTIKISASDLSFNALKPIQNDLATLDYLTIVTNHGSENLNGLATYHYTIEIDTAKLGNILQKLDSQASTSEIFNSKNFKVNADIWIGKQDAYIYKISLPKTTYMDPSQTLTTTSQTEITLSNYNKPLVVIAPAQSVSLEEILNKFLGTTVNSLKASSVSASKK